MEKKLSLLNFPVNEDNPFLRQTVEEVSNHIVKKWTTNGGTSRNAILTAVDSDNKPVGHTTFVRQRKVDSEKFTKIYTEFFKAFFDLTQAGIRVFGYIMQSMKPSKDTVVFSYSDCMKYTGYKAKGSVYKGIAELLRGGIIARTKEEWLFFINPQIIWNGDRVSFINDYIKVTDNAKHIQNKAKTSKHERLVTQAQIREWRLNEEVLFKSNDGKESARIIDMDTDNGTLTLLLYKTNRTVMIGANSELVIRRELPIDGS